MTRTYATRDPKIVAPIRRMSSPITFVEGRVDEVDLQQRRITLAVGEATAGIVEERPTLESDQLVIALGSVRNFHEIDGLQARALTIHASQQREWATWSLKAAGKSRHPCRSGRPAWRPTRSLKSSAAPAQSAD